MCYRAGVRVWEFAVAEVVVAVTEVAVRVG